MEIIIYLLIYMIVYLFVFVLSKSLDMFSKETNKNLIPIKKLKYLFIKYKKDNTSNSNYIGLFALCIQIINYLFSTFYFIMMIMDVINEPNYLNGLNTFLPKLTFIYFLFIFISDFIIGFTIYIIVNESIPNLKANKPHYKKGIKIFTKGFTNEVSYTKEITRFIFLIFFLILCFLQFIFFGFKYKVISFVCGILIVFCFTLISTSIARFYYIFNKKNYLIY